MTTFKNQVKGLSINECMKKWKALRDRFVENLKKLSLQKVVIVAQSMYHVGQILATCPF